MNWDLTSVSDEQLAACQALVYSLLQRCDLMTSERGYAIALVSSHPGAGVSHIQHLLTEMLNENEAGCAIALDCNDLGLENAEPDVPPTRRAFWPLNGDRRSSLAARSGVARYRDRIGHLNSLREAHSFVLLDCHSIRERSDVLGLARAVDGCILVVECDRTTSAQVTELERNIEKYGGVILGSVLNKTADTLPGWMSALLEKVGV